MRSQSLNVPRVIQAPLQIKNFKKLEVSLDVSCDIRYAFFSTGILPIPSGYLYSIFFFSPKQLGQDSKDGI